MFVGTFLVRAYIKRKRFSFFNRLARFNRIEFRIYDPVIIDGDATFIFFEIATKVSPMEP